MVYTSVEQFIGGTPLMEVTHLEKEYDLKARVLVKIERGNPAGSAKDRAAVQMLNDAEKKGLLKAGGTVIEPTSGNTGIALAMVGAVRGYKVIIVMPDSMSIERIKLMRAYGAKVVLTPGALGMSGAIEKAKQLQAENPGSIIAGQFDNPANAEAHYLTTGPEIWRDTEGKVDLFIAGVGTGGTVTGTGRYLKEQSPAIRVIGVEPSDSPLLTAGKAGPHPLQGIGANFIPAVLDQSILDEVLTVSGPEAYAAARVLAAKEGLLCGITSGAALHAAMSLARLPENAGKTIVALLPDTGERYLSGDLYE